MKGEKSVVHGIEGIEGDAALGILYRSTVKKGRQFYNGVFDIINYLVDKTDLLDDVMKKIKSLENGDEQRMAVLSLGMKLSNYMASIESDIKYLCIDEIIDGSVLVLKEGLVD